MKPLVHVVDVKPIGPFKLFVRFSDGTEGERDFTSYVQQKSGPMLEPLKDPTYFARVFIDYGALTWPNGFDWCPDSLHAEMQQMGLLRTTAAAE